MYELFLLGKLMERSWYGYEIHRVINAFVGPMRKVSWGSIYPTLRRMEREGLIRAAATDAADTRGRQRYTITAAGKRRFVERMRPEELNDGDYRDMFRVMMGNFSRVDSDTRRSLISGYLERLAAVMSHADEMAERVKLAPELNDRERAHILIALRRDRFLAETDRRWILKEIREAPGGEDEDGRNSTQSRRFSSKRGRRRVE